MGKFLQLILYLLLSLFFFSCPEKKGTDSVLTQETKSQKEIHHLINNKGDTIPTGVPIPLTAKQIILDSEVKTKSFTLSNNLKKVAAHTNVRRLSEPKIVKVPQAPKTITPGENGVPIPHTLKASKKVVPAFQPEPVIAGSFRMRDNAIANIQFLGVEEGIGDYYIRSLLEDSRGNIWFRDRFGSLCRYDGEKFTFFPNPKDTNHSHAHSSLIEDNAGNIWLCTIRGLVCYDGNTFTYYSNELFTNYQAVTSLIQDRQGNIWFGTFGKGAVRFSLKNGQGSFVHYTTKEGICDDNIVTIIEDRQGNIWFGSQDGGVSRFDGHSFISYTQNEGLSNKRVDTILEDQKGNIWFGMRGGGLYRFNANSGQDTVAHFTSSEGLYNNYVYRMIEDSKGVIWYGSFDKSLIRFDGKTITCYNEENGTNSAYGRGLLEDSYGNLWFGTNEGLHRFGAFRFKNYNEEFNFLDVETVTEDSYGNLWFGTKGSRSNDIIKFDGKAFIQLDGIDDYGRFEAKRVTSIAEDSQKNFWFGTRGGGLAYFDGRQFTQYQFDDDLDNYVTSILIDHEHNSWFGTKSGLTFFNGESFTRYIPEYGLHSNYFQSIIEDNEQNLWFGNRHYLGRFDGKSFTYFTKKEGLPNNLIHCILKDKKGKLWIGTDNGLSCYDGNQFINFSQKDGLINNQIFTLTEDNEQNIWAGTINGLSVLKPIGADDIATEEAKARSFKIYNFEKADGMKQADFVWNSAFLDSKNRMWWGKSKGAMMLDLNEFEFPTKPPKIHLDYIELKQQYVDYRKLSDNAYAHTLSFGETLNHAFDSVAAFYNYPLNLSLPFDLNHLTFHFSGIDWAAPHRLRYSYWVEGLDEDWSIPQSEPNAEYRNLPHGTFILKVKAIGAAQVWSEPFEYTFTILPPWWHTLWAYSLYAMGFLLFLWGLYSYQRRRWLLQTQLQVEQEKADRLKELDHFKSRFYTNITHEFRTPLTVIKGMTQQISGNEKIKTIVRRNSDRLLNMVNQLLDLSKLETNNLSVDWVQGDIIPYLQYLTESCHSLAEKKHLNLAFFSKEESLVMDFDETKMQHILINLLSNAIKFTPEYGSVKVIAEQVLENGSPYLQLAVTDTGKGIPEEKLAHIFDRFYQVDSSATRSGEGSGIGLALVKELVQLLEGRIEVESELDKGTSFLVYLPIRQNASVTAIEAVPSQPISAFGEAVVSPHPTLTSSTTNGKKPLVLIVEDNSDVTEYIISCLEKDYSLQTARNGREGVEKALEGIPDVILCDVMMPEMDGFEVCQNLKTNRLTSHIPIVLLTAKATQEDKVTGLAHGADAYLTKPFDKEELLVRLKNLAAQSKLLKERLLAPANENAKTGGRESKEAEFLKELKHIIEANMANELFNTNHLCREIAMSRTQLHRKLKALTDQSTANYIRSIRLQKARSLLEKSDLPIGEIASQVGYKDFSHFSRSFLKEFGVQPSATRN